MKKQKQTPAALLRYCVGIDVGKDTLHLCVSAIDADGKVSVKGSRQFPNRVPAFEVLEAWCARHCKDKALPVRYLMESTGVYHEQIVAPVPRRSASQRRAAQQGQSERRSDTI